MISESQKTCNQSKACENLSPLDATLSVNWKLTSPAAEDEAKNAYKVLCDDRGQSKVELSEEVIELVHAEVRLPRVIVHWA